MADAAAPADKSDGGWTPDRSVAGDRNPWSIVGVISIATFMTVLDTSIANVALDHIAGSLAVSYDEATWITTSFLVATAIIIPISGWLADVIGRKRYYMISVAVFTFASFLCGIAPNISFLVMARVLQGAAGGGLAAVEQSMLVDTFPPAKRGLAFAAYGLVVIVGPVVGPVVGGLITDNFSWHWCFLINVPIGVLSLFLVHAYVTEPPAMIAARKKLLAHGLKVDFLGFLLIALALGALEITLDRGQEDGWFGSTFITTSAIIGAVSFILFVPWELTRNKPIVPIRMFANRNFGIASIFLMIVGVIIFGTTQFIPQLLQQVMGYTATNAGLALTTGGIATVLVMPVTGLLVGRVDLRWLIGAGFGIQALALWNMTHLDTDMSFSTAAFARMIQSLGLPLLFVPITNMAYVGLKPGQSNQASALMNVARNLGGTIGISTVQTMLAQREQWHRARMVETLSPLNPNYTHGLGMITQRLVEHGQPMTLARKEALGLFSSVVTRQAAMLSYIDVFKTLMVVVLAAFPLMLLLRGQNEDGASK